MGAIKPKQGLGVATLPKPYQPFLAQNDEGCGTGDDLHTDTSIKYSGFSGASEKKMVGQV